MVEFHFNLVILASSMVIWLICLLVLEIVRRQSAHPVDGLRLWMAAIGFALAGSGNLLLHSWFPPSPYFGLGSFAMFGVVGMMYASIRAFVQRPLQTSRIVYPLLLAFATVYYLAVIAPFPYLRVAITALVCAGICMCSFIELRHIKPRGGPEQFTASMFIFLLAANALRLLTLAMGLLAPDSIFGSSDPHRFYLLSTSIIVMTTTIGFLLMVDRRQQAQLMYRVARDGQTGAFMRNAFFELLGRELNRTQRSGAPLTLMMIDIDKFKHINDTWGHHVGDLVIADFVSIAQSTLRDYDALGRFGGDEFMILLPDTWQEEARIVAERIRSQCAASGKSGLPPYSISIGMYCTAVGSDSLETVMGAADKALYRAKQSGRNRIESDINGVAPSRHAHAAMAIPPAVAGMQETIHR